MAPARCIAHLDMDAFYASVEQLRRPELRGRPVVVGGNGRRGVVAAASYEARAFGIHSAMPSSEARRRCPDAVFVPADFAAYRDASAKVFSVLRQYTPVIEPIALDEAYLDLTASPEARADPQATARRIKDEVKIATGGLTASIGIGTSKLVAKIASDLRKPDALVDVRAGTEAEFLAPLPIRALPGLGPASESRLAGLGLRTVGDIARSPADALKARLGSQGLAIAAMARGEDPRPVVVPGLPKSISREVTFDVDVTDIPSLRQTARGLAQEVTQSLRRTGVRAKTVRLKLRFANFDTHTFQATVPEPTDLDDDVLAGIDGLIRSALPDPRPVRLIGVGLSGLVDAFQVTIPDEERSRKRSLDASLDDLRRRFGPTAVSRGTNTRSLRERDQVNFRKDDVDEVASH